MARKSRKHLEAEQFRDNNPPKKVFYAGAYIRLSGVDRKQKGDSIETQSAIINAFISECVDIELIETYIDNGLSGQSFERPAFKRMIDDIESGKINCCLTKDLSRLGRNAIDAGYYIEKYFPSHGVRFIAITDDYDSANSNSGPQSVYGGILVNLKNMVNETYALEIGNRIRSIKQMNIRNGCFVGKIAPYGYFKSCEDNHKLVADEYAAPIVRHMFEMAADGQGVGEILNWLNYSEILPPKRYFHSIGLVSEKEVGGHIHWNRTVIYSILKNRVYCGDMVQGKGKTKSYILKKVPESEWIITENTHEAIISRALFEQVQMSWRKSNKHQQSAYSSPKVENIFLRKIFCGHCGYAMRRHRNGETQYRFTCDTRRLYRNDDCRNVGINEKMLKEILLEKLRKQDVLSDIFHEVKTDFISCNVELLNNKKSTKNYNEELTKVQSKIEKTNHFLKSLYENLVDGDITDDEFKQLKAGYETQIATLIERKQQLRESSSHHILHTNTLTKASDCIATIKGISDINAEVIDRLVDKILVFDDGNIEVHFKFTSEAKSRGLEVQAKGI